MAKKAKKRPPLKGSDAASPLVAEALRQLLKTKARIKTMQARAKMLQGIIIKGGCGCAHGYRSYVYHAPAWRGWVTKKGGTQLKLVPLPAASK